MSYLKYIDSSSVVVMLVVVVLISVVKLALADQYTLTGYFVRYTCSTV